MSSQPSPDAARNFFTIVVDLQMLSEDVARSVVDEAAASNVTPLQIALQKGLLDSVQVDIIEALLHPTEIVPGYEILDLIGRGGMGVVYRARQQNLDRIVALKTVLVGQMGNPNMVRRFEQEAITVARLRHPNIVAAHDFGRHAGRLFFAMELVEGKDVENLIEQQGQLDETTVLQLARQVAAGLSHAAHAGIVHRDIKPANLLLVTPPEGHSLPDGLPMVKVADFGLAFLTADRETQTRLTADNSTLGSPHYMAPEQISGESVDHRADVYSLGATMYHMLAGRPPFGDKKLPQILMQKLSGETPSLEKVRPGVLADTSALIAEMLDRDPGRRIADYASLIERIDNITSSSVEAAPLSTFPVPNASTRIVATEPTQLLRPPEPRVDGRREPRRRTLIAMLVVTAVVMAGLTVWTVVFDGSDIGRVSRDMVTSGWSEQLFDGRRLAALPSSGNWVVEKDDEGGIVIEGTQGVIRRSLVRRDLAEPRPLENYRLQLFVRLHQASAVEVHFAISADKAGDSERFVLRITPGEAVLARRHGDRGPIDPITEAISVAGDADKLHVVTIERQRRHWWAFVDERQVGLVAETLQPRLAEFRLAAEAGPAWFSDILVEELVEPGEQVR